MVAVLMVTSVGSTPPEATRNAHDGAHVKFHLPLSCDQLRRRPVRPTQCFSSIGLAEQGNQGGAADIANPAGVGTGVTTGAGQKGLALLNQTTGDYDAVYYDPTNGNGTESFSLTQADLVGAGVSLADNYQLDFFENDDGSWGWTRLNQVRLDDNAVAAIPEPTSLSLFGLAGFALIFFRRRK